MFLALLVIAGYINPGRAGKNYQRDQRRSGRVSINAAWVEDVFHEKYTFLFCREGAEGMDTSDDEENEDSERSLAERAGRLAAMNADGTGEGTDEYNFDSYEQESK